MDPVTGSDNEWILLLGGDNEWVLLLGVTMSGSCYWE